MTIERFCDKKGEDFSTWIRHNLPDSITGYMVSDIDFVMYNYRKKIVALVEVKFRNRQIARWQENMFRDISRWIRQGIDNSWKYLGFNVVTFIGDTFDDGVLLNGKQITEQELIEYLSFIRLK